MKSKNATFESPASGKKAIFDHTQSNTELSAEQNFEQEHWSIWNIVPQNVRYSTSYGLIPPLNPLPSITKATLKQRRSNRGQFEK